MADQKITDLTALLEPASGDVLPIVSDPTGSATTKKITMQNILRMTMLLPLTPIIIANGGGGTTFGNQGCVGRDGNLYLAGTQSQGLGMVKTSIVVYKSTDGGATWVIVGTPQSPTDFTTAPTGITIDVDANGLIGVAFISTNSTYPNCTNVGFLLWDGSAWNVYQMVSTQNTASYTPTGVSLSVSATNVWHIAWCQKTTNSTTSARLNYNTRTAGDAGTWAGTTELDDVNGNASASHLVLDSNNFPHIIFIDGGDSANTKRQTNASGGWLASVKSGSAAIPGQCVIDSANTIYFGTSTASVIMKLTIADSWSTLTATGRLWNNSQQVLLDTSDNLYVTNITHSTSPSMFVQKFTALAGTWGATCQTLLAESFSASVVYTWPSARALAVPCEIIMYPPSILGKINLTG